MADDDLALQRRRIQEEIARLQAEDLVLSRRQFELGNANDNRLPFWGRDRVGLVSFPRSGNSFLRKIIENLTGTVTGSDGNPARLLNQQLQEMGLNGEGKLDAWCVKTHYPERVGRARLTLSRFILIVRNPIDAILSFFQMLITDSHSSAITKEELDAKFGALWRDFLLEEVSVWIQFHEHWQRVMLAEEKLPSQRCLLLRYEDLVDAQKQAGEVEKLARFLYKDIQAEEATQELVRKYLEAHANTRIYPEKSRPHEERSLFKSAAYYSDEQFLHVLASTRSQLTRYGYWDACCSEWERRRSGEKLDLVSYIDKQVDECIVVHGEMEQGRFWLNSKYALRPRTKEDPYGRGFDIRWERRLASLLNAASSTPEQL